MLLRKAGRYHVGRRDTFGSSNRNPINFSFGTEDPVDARRIASRLAIRCDGITMYAADRIERGTLAIEELRTFFRRGLEEEPAAATRHVTSQTRPEIHEAAYEVAEAADWIVASVPHDATNIAPAQIEPVTGEGHDALLVAFDSWRRAFGNPFGRHSLTHCNQNAVDFMQRILHSYSVNNENESAPTCLPGYVLGGG